MDVEETVSSTECVSGDWFGEVREVADLKKERLDVCYVFTTYLV